MPGNAVGIKVQKNKTKQNKLSSWSLNFSGYFIHLLKKYTFYLDSKTDEIFLLSSVFPLKCKS